MAAYTNAMEQMAQRYPDDFEASVYYALTLQASAPKNDKTYANQLKSAEILERLFKQNPDHPGVAHYLVHAYDYPPLADKGIGSAGFAFSWIWRDEGCFLTRVEHTTARRLLSAVRSVLRCNSFSWLR